VLSGWAFIYQSGKWHFFRGWRSICGKWGTTHEAILFPRGNKEDDMCAKCWKRVSMEGGC